MENVWFLFFVIFMASVRDIRSHLYVMRSDSFFFYVYGAVPKEEEKKRGELAMRIGDDPVVSGLYWQCKTKKLWPGFCSTFPFLPRLFPIRFFLFPFGEYDSWRVSID